MEALPISWPLKGRRVVLFGGGERARAKLEILANTPAEIVVYADEPGASFEGATVRPLWPAPAELEGAAFAIVALDDAKEAAAAARLAREAGLLVNAVDRP